MAIKRRNKPLAQMQVRPVELALLRLDRDTPKKESAARLLAVMERIRIPDDAWYLTLSETFGPIEAYFARHGGIQSHDTEYADLAKAYASLMRRRQTYGQVFICLEAFGAYAKAYGEQDLTKAVNQVSASFWQSYLGLVSSLLRRIEESTEKGKEAGFVQELQTIDANLWPEFVTLPNVGKDKLHTMLQKVHSLAGQVGARCIDEVIVLTDELQKKLLACDWGGLDCTLKIPDRGAYLIGNIGAALEYFGRPDLAHELSLTERFVSAAMRFLDLTHAFEPIPHPMSIEDYAGSDIRLADKEALRALGYFVKSREVSEITPQAFDIDFNVIVKALTIVVEYPRPEYKINALASKPYMPAPFTPDWNLAQKDVHRLKLGIDIWLPVYFATLIACGGKRAEHLLEEATKLANTIMKFGAYFNVTSCRRVAEAVGNLRPQLRLTIGQAYHIISGSQEIFTGGEAAEKYVRDWLEKPQWRSEKLESSEIHTHCMQVADRADTNLGTKIVRESYARIGYIFASDQFTGLSPHGSSQRLEAKYSECMEIEQTNWATRKDRNFDFETEFKRLSDLPVWKSKVKRKVAAAGKRIVGKIRNGGKPLKNTLWVEVSAIKCPMIVQVLVAREIILWSALRYENKDAMEKMLGYPERVQARRKPRKESSAGKAAPLGDRSSEEDQPHDTRENFNWLLRKCGLPFGKFSTNIDDTVWKDHERLDVRRWRAEIPGS